MVAIGVDIGGTHMRVARVGPDGRILARKNIAGSRDKALACTMIEDLIAGLDSEDVTAIGIGVPGRVDAATGEVLSGGFLDLSGCDLKNRLETRFSRPVTIANDCSMALMGEAGAGAGVGVGNIVMLTIGTGIGGAAMVNGQIVNGRQSAGQLGHIIVQHGGLACVCGQSGCLEMYSSGTALGRQMQDAGFTPAMRCEALIEEQGSNAAARDVLFAWAGPLRSAISTLSASFDPDVVLLGGGLGHCAVEALKTIEDNGRWYRTEVKAAQLGDDAGVIGAALAALAASQAQKSGKRLVMVNGVPASGKSHVARALADRTGWPVLALDTIKNPFLEELGPVDRLFNRRLGRASYHAIFDLMQAAPEGSTFIVDAWFGFQPLGLLDEGLERAGISACAELFCHAPPALIGSRYKSRLGARPAGHPGEEYVCELVALAESAQPSQRAPAMRVDTSSAETVDIAAIERWVGDIFKGL